jgi:collagen type III alpha
MMRKIAIGLIPAAIMFSGAAVKAAPAWQVSEVSGNVKLTENGRSRLATKGALLASGAVITTASGSRAVIVRGQEFVVISPTTQIRVPEASSSNPIIQLIEDFGSAIFKVDKKSTPHFGVKTPYLAAVVKGTTFTVTVGPEGSKVKVREGLVEVSTPDGGASDLVPAGGSASVGKGDLYTLNVEGKESKVLRSSKAPAAGAVTTNPSAAPAAASKGDNRSARAQEVRIANVIREERVSLEKSTRGLLKDNFAAEHAQAEFNGQARRLIQESKPGKNPPGGGDKPANEEKPDKEEKPEKEEKPGKDGKPDPAKPEEPKGGGPGTPPGPGAPADPGKPEDFGRPSDPGKPGNGPPDDPGKPTDQD